MSETTSAVVSPTTFATFAAVPYTGLDLIRTSAPVSTTFATESAAESNA